MWPNRVMVWRQAAKHKKYYIVNFKGNLQRLFNNAILRYSTQDGVRSLQVMLQKVRWVDFIYTLHRVLSHINNEKKARLQHSNLQAAFNNPNIFVFIAF